MFNRKSLPKISNILLALLLITLSSAGTFGLVVVNAGPVSVKATATPPKHDNADVVGPLLTQLQSRFYAFRPSENFPVTGSRPPTQSGEAPVNTPVNRATPHQAGAVKPATFPGATLNCFNPNPKCDKVVSGPAGSPGLNGLDNRGVNAFSVEPPDQGLCVGNGYVVEPVNLVIKVFSTSFTQLSGDVSLNNFFGFPIERPSQGFTGPFISDPKCLFDTDSGHWFVTSLLITGYNGPVQNFALGVGQKQTQGYLLIAVSRTTIPTGTWNIYSLNVTNQFAGDFTSCNSVKAGVTYGCFGDQPLIGANKDAFVFSTNQFSLNPDCSFGPTCPFGDTGFDGTQLYFIDKQGLAQGWLPGLIDVAVFDPGEDFTAPGCSDFHFCGFFSLQPATSPAASEYDNGGCVASFSGRAKCGVEYFLGSDDFITGVTSDISLWGAFETTTLHGGPACNTLLGPPCGDDDMFVDEPTFISTETYVFPSQAEQKAGLIPLGDLSSSPEGGIQTNDDRMNQVVYAGGLLWSGVNTEIQESIKNSKPSGAALPDPHKEIHTGIAYFIVKAKQPLSGHTHPLGSLQDQGFVAAWLPAKCTGSNVDCGQNVLFPSIGVGPGGETSKPGHAVMVFTLTGHDFYPSVAFGDLTSTSHKLSGLQIETSLLGTQPQDGFTEYSGGSRWGDYSAAVWSDGKVYIAGEYIGSGCLNDFQYSSDPSCGATRSNNSNWWTGLAAVS